MTFVRYPFANRSGAELEALLANPQLDPRDREKIQKELASRGEGPKKESKRQLLLFNPDALVKVSVVPRQHQK